MTARLVPALELTDDRWCTIVEPRAVAPLQVFCFPHAGGAASSQRGWDAAFAGHAEVAAIELPGRAERWSEPPCAELEALAIELAAAIGARVDRPYALVGTSMGGLLAYEVACLLEDASSSAPAGLLVCGTRPPYVPAAQTLHTLPDEELLRQLRRLDGIPPEVAAHQELLELLLPTIRADVAAAERHGRGRAHRLACPVVTLVGRQDPLVPLTVAEAWAEATASFELIAYEGGHFPTTAVAGRAAEALMRVIDHDLQRRGAQCL